MVIPDCLTCTHFVRGTGAPTCRAFPAGIPPEIYFRGASHTAPVEGDHGLRYESLSPDELVALRARGARLIAEATARLTRP